MTALSDFPPDVQRAAEIAVFAFEARIQSGEFEGLEPDGTEYRDALKVEVAKAIAGDRAARQQSIDLAGLTIGQAAVLEFIAQFQRDNGGRSPTFDQIAAGAGFSSKSNVSRILDILTDRGRISRDPKTRAITIIANPSTGA